MTTGPVGGSKVRSASPSAIKTIAFCKPPFESVTTSWVRTARGCCLAQLGSADMLMGLDGGAIPANLTTPFITAAPALVPDERGPSAFTTCRLEIQLINVKAIARTKFFGFILLLENGCFLKICFVSEVAQEVYSAWRTRLSCAARLARKSLYPKW